MTRNGSSPAMSTALADDGTRLFFWDGGTRLELLPMPLDRRGRRWVEVYQGETLLTSGRVNFGELHDRQQLALHCAPDGEEAVKAWLGRFVEVATALKHSPAQADLRTLDVRQLSQVAPERVEWLWKPLLPLGRPVSLEGNPGVGKSNMVLKIAAHLTTGMPFPTLLQGMPPRKRFPHRRCVCSPPKMTRAIPFAPASR